MDIEEFSNLPVEALDEVVLFAYAEDPRVEMVVAIGDDNAPHGVNTEDEMLVSGDGSLSE